jgi:hypothetical protein
MTRYCKEDFEGEIGRRYKPTLEILRVMPMAVEMNHTVQCPPEPRFSCLVALRTQSPFF